MQTNNVEGQMTLSDVDISFGKMCQEVSVRENPREQTSKPSSQRSSKSSNPPLPMCLCLRGGDGQNRERSMEWAKAESPFPWLGNFTMHSIGVSRNGEKESVYWLTSTDSPQPNYCLTLNLSEQPRVANPTRLSEILEEDADPKFNLSAKACQGILNRAQKRGKQLPEILQKALEAQAESNA